MYVKLYIMFKYSAGISYITMMDIYIFREGIHYSYMCCKKANHNTCIYNKPLTFDNHVYI